MKVVEGEEAKAIKKTWNKVVEREGTKAIKNKESGRKS